MEIVLSVVWGLMALGLSVLLGYKIAQKSKRYVTAEEAQLVEDLRGLPGLRADLERTLIRARLALATAMNENLGLLDHVSAEAAEELFRIEKGVLPEVALKGTLKAAIRATELISDENSLRMIEFHSRHYQVRYVAHDRLRQLFVASGDDVA